MDTGISMTVERVICLIRLENDSLQVIAKINSKTVSDFHAYMYLVNLFVSMT